METCILLRDEHLKTCTRGKLFAKGKEFQILEPPWLDNKNDISCIPPGRYECEFIERSPSGKYRNVYHIKDVKDRVGVLCHNGCVVANTLGCLLIGKRRGYLAGQPAILNSKTALYEFVELMERKPFILWIIG